jgi:hypothetical protein
MMARRTQPKIAVSRMSASNGGLRARLTNPPCELLRLARKLNPEARVRQNNPTGKSPKTLSSPFCKNIPLNPSGKSVL